jgi:hypothetical protein
MTRRWSLFVLCAALLGSTTGARADRETAEFVAGRADKALQARAWAEAQTLFRKALDEDATLLRARLGLGEALLGAGERLAAVAEIRRFLEEAGRVEPPPAGLSALVTRARKRLAELETLDGELDRQIDAHVGALVAFAGRWRERDRAVAVQALEAALRLAPDHAQAAAQLEALSSGVPASVTSLFNGRDATGWTWLEPPMWQVRDGILAAKAVGAPYLCRTTGRTGGDFDVRMEARFVQQWGPRPTFLLCAPLDAGGAGTRFGVALDSVVLEEVTAGGAPEVRAAKALAEVVPALDVKAWNVYELRFRGDVVSAYVQGTQLFRAQRSTGRAEGHIGLHVDCCAVEFRRVEVARR